jgi:hypothetical protein
MIGGEEMKPKRDSIKSIFVIAVSLGLMASCAGLKNYGTLKSTTGKVTINDLIENWQNYRIYYAGLAVDNPSAIMFDTKIEGRRITSDKWVPVTEKSVAASVVGWLNANINYPSELWEIVGPKGKFFGYMYSYWGTVEIKGIDDKTIWMGDLPLPPMDRDNAGVVHGDEPKQTTDGVPKILRWCQGWGSFVVPG